MKQPKPRGDDEDFAPIVSGVSPPSSLTAWADPPKPLLYTADGKPLVRPPAGFRTK